MKEHIRIWLAWTLQRWSWHLSDPHDAWMIEWKDGRKTYSIISRGHYRAAKAVARTRGGKIIGHGAFEIPA